MSAPTSRPSFAAFTCSTLFTGLSFQSARRARAAEKRHGAQRGRRCRTRESDEKGPSASFHRRGPRRPPPKPPPGIGCAGEARARTGPFNAGPCESSFVARLPTWKCSAFERRLCRRNLGLLASDARGPARGRPAARTASWGEVSEGGRSPPPSGTYREYASRAALGRRLAAGPFSSLEPERFSDGLLGNSEGGSASLPDLPPQRQVAPAEPARPHGGEAGARAGAPAFFVSAGRKPVRIGM